MKFNKVVALFLTLILILSACGKEAEISETIDGSADQSKTEAAESSTEDSAESTEVETEDMSELDSLGDVEVESGLFNVELTIPADYIGESTQEELTATAEEEGYKSIKLNEDGSATYTMTKAQHKEMLNEMKKDMDKSLEEMINSEENPNIISIEVNDNYTEYKIITTNEEIGISETFLTYTLQLYGAMYGVFSGENETDINVIYINEASGEIIAE